MTFEWSDTDEIDSIGPDRGCEVDFVIPYFHSFDCTLKLRCTL